MRCKADGLRRASAYAPENTCAAFDPAERIGSREIELDVHASLDGNAAIIHDVPLDGTTSGTRQANVWRHERWRLKSFSKHGCNYERVSE
ncbi:hypothetical protein HQ520_10460 [bacterium]|nr:hypothetical protein [bacterium]